MMVLWAHLSGYWLYENGRSWIVQDLWSQYVVVPFHLYQNAGHLGVILFFLISGYIITHTSLRETWRQFLTKRALRVFPLLFVALALSLVAIRVNTAMNLGPLPGLQSHSAIAHASAFFLVDHFLGIEYTLGPTWTLAIEITFYALVGVAVALTRTPPMRATWAMIAGWVIVSPIILGTPELGHLKPIIVYIPFLFLGRIAYLWQHRLAEAWSSATAIASTLVLFLLFYTAAFPGQLLIPQVEPIVTYAIALVAFTTLLFCPLSRVPRPLRILGDLSYSIYLLHIPVGMIVINLCIAGGAPFTVAFLTATVATLAVSYVTYKTVEIPGQRLARRISARMRPHAELR